MQYYPQTFNMTEVVLITNSYIFIYIYCTTYMLYHMPPKMTQIVLCIG